MRNETPFTTALQVLVDQIGWQYTVKGNSRSRYVGPCPVGNHSHDDQSPAFAIAADQQRYKCFKCDIHGAGPRKMLELLGQALYQTPPPHQNGNGINPKSHKVSKGPPPQGITLAELCQAKGLDLEFVRSLGWEDAPYPTRPGSRRKPLSTVRIPYHTQDGELWEYRYRINLTGNPKYWWRPHDKANPFPGQIPYGMADLWWAEAEGKLLIVEGETDQVTCQYARIPALGVPGAMAWQVPWLVPLNGIPDIYVWVEPGASDEHDEWHRTVGEKMADKIGESMPRIKLIRAPEGVKDPNELMQKLGGDREAFKQAMLDLMAEAQQWKPRPGARVDEATAQFRQIVDEDFQDAARAPKADVPFTVEQIPYRKRDKSVFWAQASEAFVYPTGVKPALRSMGAYSERDIKAGAFNFFSNTWKNPVNAQFKRRLMYFNLRKRMQQNGETIYERRVPLDDWNEKLHEAITKQVKRKGHEAKGWISFDTALAYGCYIYLTNVPELNGFSPVVDNQIATTLIHALNGLRPPDADTPGRYRPIRSSPNWGIKIDDTGEEDQGTWEVIATHPKETDFKAIEIRAIEEQYPTEETRDSFWRSQWGKGMIVRIPTRELAVQFFQSVGYARKPERRGSG